MGLPSHMFYTCPIIVPQIFQTRFFYDPYEDGIFEFGMDYDMAEAAPPSQPTGGGGMSSSAVKVRRNFPETFVWTLERSRYQACID